MKIEGNDRTMKFIIIDVLSLAVIYSMLLPTPKLIKQHSPCHTLTPAQADPLVILGKEREIPWKPLHCVVLSVIKYISESFLSFLFLEENLLRDQHFSGLFFFVWKEAWHIPWKGIGFEKECMDEQTLIYFSLRVCDVLLIGHQSGRLLPNQDQVKLMSLCRAKSRVCFVVVAA